MSNELLADDNAIVEDVDESVCKRACAKERKRKLEIEYGKGSIGSRN